VWLRDDLPYDITMEADNRPYARVMIYGYQTGLSQSRSMQNLEDLASSFRTSLLELMSVETPRPIIFIAHSLGGLIVKQVRLFLISVTKFSYDVVPRLLYCY
jgi:protein SERAC1